MLNNNAKGYWKQGNKYYSSIKCMGKNIHLGVFGALEDFVLILHYKNIKQVKKIFFENSYDKLLNIDIMSNYL